VHKKRATFIFMITFADVQTDFQFSFTVVFRDEPYTKRWRKTFHFLLNVLPHYFVKVECSAVRLFIHTCYDQNNLQSVRS